MLNGDISNYVEEIVGFRFDDFLVTVTKEKGLLNSKTLYSLNNRVAKALTTVYYRTSMTVDIVCMLKGDNEEKFREKVESLLESFNIPYRVLHIIKQDLEVRTLLTTNAISYYIDDDSNERFNRIRKSDYCWSIETLYKMISRRV